MPYGKNLIFPKSESSTSSYQRGKSTGKGGNSAKGGETGKKVEKYDALKLRARLVGRMKNRQSRCY